MNNELGLISEWLKSNKLNITKTFNMVFHMGIRKCLGDIELFIDNTKINETNTMKYLGVIIDAKLNWISHIIHVECAKCVDVLNYKNINIYKLYGLTQLLGNTIGSSIDVVQ